MKRYLTLVALFLSSVWGLSETVPPIAAYQGRLTDSGGSPVADGTGYEVEIRLWGTATGGTAPLWAARYPGVAVRNGALNVILGSPSAIAIAGAATPNLAEAFATPNIFLGMTVTKGGTGAPIANPVEILPRQQWMSSPFAFRAEIAGGTTPGAVTGTMIADGAVAQQDLADGAVGTVKLADQAVTSAKIAAQAVGNSHIGAGAIAPDRLAMDYAMFWDERATGSLASVAGWQTRTYNNAKIAGQAISRTPGSGSFSTIVLQPGTYFIDIDQPTFGTQYFMSAVYEVGAAPESPSLQSVAGYSVTNNVSQLISHLSGFLEVTGSVKSYEVRFFSQAANTSGLGNSFPSGLGIPQHFGKVSVLRVK